jgi:hypothetical protein
VTVSNCSPKRLIHQLMIVLWSCFYELVNFRDFVLKIFIHQATTTRIKLVRSDDRTSLGVFHCHYNTIGLLAA